MDGHQNVLALPQAPDAIELRHLRAFVAVADDLSFSRAPSRNCTDGSLRRPT